MLSNASSAVSAHRILVVDDEEIVLAGLRENLIRVGYQVVALGNPLEALEALKSQPFSVLISDQQMPGMNGLDFLARAKEYQPDATRILITAVLNLNTVIDAINKGEIFRFIVKPWLREELLVTVRNAVQRFDLICKNTQLQVETQAMNERLRLLNQSLEQQVARVEEQNRQMAVLNQALEQNLDRSVRLCLHTMEIFNPRLGQQARRAFQICSAMAETLGMPAEQRQTLEISAWLHDIGLLGIPRHLIGRWRQDPTGLTPSEWASIHHHPVLGQELASFAYNLGAVGITIRAHHERYDGTGYPDKLAGEQIPWLGRLLAVAVNYAEQDEESWDAVESIRRGSGTVFDPQAVRVFLRSLPKTAAARKEHPGAVQEHKGGPLLSRAVHTAYGTI